MFLVLCIFLLTSTGTIAVFQESCSTKAPNNTTTDCISQCITFLYKSIDCSGYRVIGNLTDIIANRNETMPALIANEYLHVKGSMVSVVSICDSENGIKVYRRPNELIDFMNNLRDIEQSSSEWNHQTLKKMISSFEQLKSKFNQSNQWCVRSLGLEEQMKQIKQKVNTSLELEVTIFESTNGTTEHKPLNFTYVIETHKVHPREHHYTRSVWLILFISIVLMAVLITISIFLRCYLNKNTQQPVQPKSMLNLIDENYK